MNDSDGWNSILTHLRDNASARAVYGEPIETQGRTVVPVAKVWYGFGGGAGPEVEEGGPETAAQTRGEVEEGVERREAYSGGSGGGGGVRAVPTGVVEITDDGTRFVSFSSGKKLALVAAVCLLVGYLFGRRSG